MVSAVFSIENNDIGRIIGKNGVNIKRISKEYNIYINISRESDENGERKIILSHFYSTEKLIKAKIDILSLCKNKDYISDLLICQKEKCPICLEILDVKKNYCSTKCGHYFHMDCLLLAIKTNKNCPICRRELTEFKIKNTLTDQKIDEIVDSTINYGINNNLLNNMNYFFLGYNANLYIYEFLKAPLTYALQTVKLYLEI